MLGRGVSSGRGPSAPEGAVAKVRIVVGALITRIPLPADAEARAARALVSFGAFVRVNERREVVFPRIVTWRTKV
jgi:hypothetical protein